MVQTPCFQLGLGAPGVWGLFHTAIWMQTYEPQLVCSFDLSKTGPRRQVFRKMLQCCQLQKRNLPFPHRGGECKTTAFMFWWELLLFYNLAVEKIFCETRTFTGKKSNNAQRQEVKVSM